MKGERIKKLIEHRNDKKIIVLAGNFVEFQHYARENHEIIDRLVYASGKEALAGINAEKVITIGTFWHKDNAGELWDFANARINP